MWERLSKVIYKWVKRIDQEPFMFNASYLQFNRKWLCENVPEFEETCHSVSSHRIDKP